MLLSIIIPVINESESLEAVLKPLQDLRKNQLIEIIVVDGGSQDDTLSKSKSFADKVISSQKSRSRQMNAGAECSAGDVLLFLHADTKLPQNFYTELQKFYDGKTRIWGFFPVRLSGQYWLFRVIERAINIRSRLTSVATGDQAIFVSRALFNSVGKFPKISLMEDVALSKSLRNVKIPCVAKYFVQTSSRRWEKNGIIRTICLMWMLRLQYFLGVNPEKLVKSYYGKH